MDGLALLCNLFADGPVTLRRLRAAQVRSLESLELVPPATLAAWLHSSLPQARALAEQARKLARRLAEEPGLVPGAAARAEPMRAPREPVFELSPRPLPLRAGLIDGLDDALVARLVEHGVRSLPALIEFASLALARRTGIPHSTLLELAHRARRCLAAPPLPAGPASRGRLAAPVGQPPRPARLDEDHPADEFTLPLEERGAAGPFG